MVDLSQVKMPVVEYEDGLKVQIDSFGKSRAGNWLVNNQLYQQNGIPLDIGPCITAIHPSEPAADGWVRTEHAAMKQFDDCTIAVNLKSRHWSSCGELPTWLICSTAYTTAEIDAAYAAHVAAKPVLVWDESLAFLKVAASRDLRYVVRTITKEAWYAEVYSPNLMTLIGANFVTEEAAKAACERHARGE